MKMSIFSIIMSIIKAINDAIITRNDIISVSPEGWYHGSPPLFSLAPPPFNFKAYTEKQCFITLLTEHRVPLMHSSTLNIYAGGNTEYTYYNIGEINQN